MGNLDYVMGNLDYVMDNLDYVMSSNRSAVALLCLVRIHINNNI